MMDYEIFKAVVKENFLRYLPEEYRDAEIRIYPAKKINRTLDALTVLPVDGSQIFPTIYVNDMYENYQSCDDLETALLQAAGQYAKVLGSVKDYKPDIDMEHLRDNVVMCLVNTEQNKDLLAGTPNREFQDLSVIYRWVVDQSPDALGSVVVSDKLAEAAGMTEEELFQCACRNTRRISPVSIMTMQEVMFELMSMPPEMRGMFVQEKTPSESMWIISNERRINGAVSMLYEENLHQLAEKVGDDLFILPSSIHEVIAIPAGMAAGNLKHLLEMVYDINMGELELGERLSNSVYHYDRNARTVILAAESPEKRLDGKQAELPLIQEENKTR